MLTKEKVQPHLADLASGKTTQTKLAGEFGVTQTTLSQFLARHFPAHHVGRGGIHPSTTDAMKAAVLEAINHGNIAIVAKTHGVNYLALYRRVQKAREKPAKEAARIAKLVDAAADELRLIEEKAAQARAKVAALEYAKRSALTPEQLRAQQQETA